MEDDLKKIMEDNLNFKAVLLGLFDNKNLKNKWFWHHRDWPSLRQSIQTILGQDGQIHIIILSAKPKGA